MDPYAAVAETHISTVFFAGERAYKLMKPVRTGFLDHSTVESRRRACHRELELNRRLAPDVYLGVSEIVEDGRVADHLLVMRRLPAERRLTVLLATPERADAVRQVARAVAAFHASQPPDERAAVLAGRDAMTDLWRHNLAEMETFAGRVLPAEHLAEAGRLAERYLAGRGPLLAHRVASGLARDGHGDLLADDIFCLADGPRILDCLAFDDALRLGDVLLDAAFLAMDLERLAGVEVSRAFLDWYHEFSNEHHPRSLVDHYIAYRALVRCKVSALRADQGVERAATEAREHLDMVLAHLRAGAVQLVLVGGAPGAGKSTAAAGLAARTGATLLSSDELRKDLTGLARTDRAFERPGEGIYDAETTARVYAELVERAALLASLGESVVLDASWTTATARGDARRAAAGVHADVVELRCVVDPAIARSRIERRLAAAIDVSDATPEIADHLTARADPWPEASVLDTTLPADDVARAAFEATRPA